jgi:hypothetical protein
LLGALALVLLVEQGVVRQETRLLQPLHWDWRFSSAASAGAGAAAAIRADILGLGDSLLLNGWLPAVVEQASGRSAYNLAVSSGHPASSYYLLRRALRAGAHPAMVVIGHSPLALDQKIDSDCLLRLWPELLDLAETADLAWRSRDARLFAAVTAARVLPSVRLRAEIRTLAANPRRARAQCRRTAHLMAQFCRNRSVNRGALVLASEETHHDSELFLSGLREKFPVDPMASVYLDRLLALASEHGVKVVWTLFPAAGLIQEACDRSGFESQRTAFFQDVQRRHPDLIIFDGRRARYDRGLYARDPLHLSEAGAAAFSASVGVALRGVLGHQGNAWTMLPGYRSGKTPDVENFDESGRMIARAGPRSRGATRRR